MLKRYALLFTAIGVLFFFSGCSSRENAAKGAYPGSSEILMWLVGSESQSKVVQAIGGEFFKESNLGFRCEAISWVDAHTKYLTCIAGGVIPDIGTMGLTWGAEFGRLGAVVDLAKEFPEDIKAIKSQNFPGLWNSAEYNSRVYGIPFDLSLQVLFYRNDIVSRPPATWKELEDTLVSLNQQGKRMLFDWGSLSWIGLAPFIWQAGGDFYEVQDDASAPKSAIASLPAQEGLKFFSRLYRELGVPKAQIPLEQGISTGDFPLAISGNWKIDSLRLSAPEIKGKWSIAMLPAGPAGKRTAFMGGRAIVIFQKSKYKKEAWEFIRHLFTPDVQSRLYQAARSSQDSYLPSNITAWDALAMEQDFKEVLRQQAKDGRGPPAVPGWNESTRFIEEAIQRVVLQDADIKSELSRAAGEMDEKIKR